MKRVLMTGDTVGGVWTFTLQLAGAFAAHGVEVGLAAMGGLPSDPQRADACRIPNLRLFESTFKLEWMPDPWADVEAAGSWLLGLEQSFAPDIIHLNSYGHGALPWAASTVLTAHSCVMSWWAAVKRCPITPEWNRYRDVVARSLQTVGLVTAPTRAMLTALQHHYGALPAARVVLNGCVSSRFQCGPKEDFILSAGRLWDEAKNIRMLARIAPSLAWPVYVAGEAGETDLTGCRALGRLSSTALADWYRRASIYVLPAHYEPFGLSILEAALSGCALVLGDIPSLREIWDDAAIFVHPDDRPRLRSAIHSLIVNRRLRSSIVQRSRQRALELTADRMALEYLEIYEEAARGAQALCA